MGSNTWQQPVAGEPNCGSPHVHWENVLNTDPASTAWTSVDLSASVPVGTTLVAIHVDMESTAAHVESTYSNASSGSSYLHLETQQANNPVHAWGIIPVSADRKIWYRVENTNVTSLIINMTLYWC